MKTQHCRRRHRLLSIVGGCFALALASTLPAQTPKPSAPPAGVDPATHAAHTAAGTPPGATPAPAQADPALAQQVSQLRAKVAQLEAALARNAPMTAMPGMGAAPGASPAMNMGMGQMKSGGQMSGMSSGSSMGGGGAGGMGMMDMMRMGGGGSGSGSMTNMSGGGGGMGMMGMMDMDMMMGMGGGSMGAMPQSALPGFPGASHLYHIGSTGFFLDHPQHIALTTEQQAALNKAKEQAALAKRTADRAIEQAEQELWTLTAADQPDAAKIEAKIREIEKLRGDERLAFIRAVGEASKLLTDEQRKSLTGFAPPAPAAAMPGGMKDM